MRIFEKISRRLAITLAGVMACSSFAMAPAITAFAAEETAPTTIPTEAERIEKAKSEQATKLTNAADYTSEVTLDATKKVAAYTIHSDIEGKLRVTVKAADTIEDAKVEFFKNGENFMTAKGDIKNVAKDKTYNLEANVKEGDYTIVVIAPEKTVKFQIKAEILTDKDTKIRNAESPAKKTAKVTVKKAKDVDGYEVRFSTSKDFDKNVKTKAVKEKKITFKDKKGTIEKSGLKSGKKYYVQVRTYIKKNGVKYYSDWSKSKKINKVK